MILLKICVKSLGGGGERGRMGGNKWMLGLNVIDLLHNSFV